MSALTQGLIIPVNLLAFAVNEKDAHDATPFFAGANTVFTDQTGETQAFLGANVNRSLMGTPAQPFQKGVHLHWALPVALSRSKANKDGTLEFKAAPNRWLVNRFVISGSKAARTSWVVLSDLLSDTMPPGQTSVTLPTYQTKSGQNYQYSGQYQPFEQNWKEPVIPSDRTFAALAGMNLTAVASGQSAFATFVPNCRGVFEFSDPLADVKLPPNGSANLMYTVTGWFSDGKLDPLSGGLTLADLQDKLSWTFDEPSTQVENKPDYSLYHGSVQGIAWHPDETYLPDYSVGNPSIELELSVGNTPTEAIAAYLQNAVQPSTPFFQILVNAYLEGLLGQLKTPQPNQLASLKGRLHENGFQGLKGGFVYIVVEKITTRAGEKEDTTYVEIEDLPPRLGDALNLLNFYLQGLQLLNDSRDAFQWQLFSDWYRIFMATTAQRQTCFNITYQKYGAVDGMNVQISEVEEEIENQLKEVTKQLPIGCELRETPAPRYWQANDPVFILNGKDLPALSRYADDGQYSPQSNLLCRLQNQFIPSLTANGVTVSGQQFAASALPVPNALPAPTVFNDLLNEDLMLNAELLSSITGAKIDYSDIRAALAGQSKSISITGKAPLLLSVSGWRGNPWVPHFTHWNVHFQPIFSTIDSTKTQIYDYPTNFFTSQFTIDQNNGDGIGFAPASNPAEGPFGQRYEGSSILSASVIQGFISQLKQSTEPILRQCLAAIEQQNMVAQAFSGLNAAFMMHDHSLQLNVGVPDDSEYRPITDAIAEAVGGHENSSPNFNGFYNPVRAGYFKASLTLIDIFGQKTMVNLRTVNVAESMTAIYKGAALPGIAYTPPRISQSARLLFRFLAAGGRHLEEMNQHPATTPICGWFLPNHLNGSLFIYDAQGASLGILFLNDAKTRIMWQSAPGNDATINMSVEQVMQDQQPQLRDLVIALSKSDPKYFNDFMIAIDRINGFVEPQEVTTNNDLAVLIGRPMAIVQTALALELKGTPEYNQSWSVLGLVPTNPLAETDNGFTEIEFPVVLGNLSNLNDGLIGYFKFGKDDYDWSNFYTMGASADSVGGVQQPTQNTVTLKARPGVGGNASDDAFRTLVMLIDPRAPLHATTGILPTKEIQLPSHVYSDTLGTIEMTFLTTPILAGNSALSVPLPTESGYHWSWIQALKVNGVPRWLTRGDISNPPPGGLWTYTPQTILEGWLRLNPDLLTFGLLNSDKKGIVAQGRNDNLSLNVTNRQGRPISFSPGAAVAEGTPPNGSIFYIHFGDAVPQKRVAEILLSANGWAFTVLADSLYGYYWAAVAVSPFELAGGGALSIQVNNLNIATDKQQVTIYFDYYDVTNINDGVYQNLLSVTPAQGTTVAPRRRQLTFQR